MYLVGGGKGIGQTSSEADRDPLTLLLSSVC